MVAPRQPPLPVSSAAASPPAFPSSARQVVLLCPNAPATTQHPPHSSFRPHLLPPTRESSSGPRRARPQGLCTHCSRCRKPPPVMSSWPAAGSPRVSNPPHLLARVSLTHHGASFLAYLSPRLSHSEMELSVCLWFVSPSWNRSSTGAGTLFCPGLNP